MRYPVQIKTRNILFIINTHYCASKKIGTAKRVHTATGEFSRDDKTVDGEPVTALEKSVSDQKLADDDGTATTATENAGTLSKGDAGQKEEVGDLV